MQKIKEIYTKYKEIINYLIVGVLTTIVSLGAYYVSVFTFLNPEDGLQLQIANILSWIVGVTFAYFTNRKFVFESEEQNKIKEASKFVASRIITLIMDMIIMFIGVTVLVFNDKIIKLVSQVVITISNYIFSKLFVFNKKEKKSKSTKKILLISLIIIITIIIGFCGYEIATVNNQYYISEKNLQIPIFVYHNIVAEESEVKEGCMQTTALTFEEQITGLMKLGYKPISYHDLVEYKNGEKPISKWSFLITFDDGYNNVYTYAYPIAKKYNIPMAIFVIDDCMGTAGYLSWNQAKEMHDSGLIGIYSHGSHHVKYNEIKKEELINQVNNSYDNLTEKLNDKNLLKVFAYPYGLYTEEGTKELEKAGYIQNLMDSKINRSHKLDLSKLHREYPENHPTFIIVLKQQYRSLKYRD